MPRTFRSQRLLPMSALLLPVLLLSGCHVINHGNDKNSNVDIATPFGSMQVKTNGNVNTADVGLTPYPGATLQQKEGSNDGAADFNLNFGSIHVGVKAVSYFTPDSQDKVLAFYRNDLKKYGDIIECKGATTIGTPARTSQGLNCAEQEHGNHMYVQTDASSDAHDSLELRTGSKQHQHIVSVEPKDGGTKFGLVALDLPKDISNDDSKNGE